MVTYKAKGVVADAHPWFAGVFMNAHVDQAVVAEADLIIGLGLDPVELLPKPWPFKAPLVLLNPWESPLGQVPVEAALTIEAHDAIDLLRAAIASTGWHQSAIAGHVAKQKQVIASTTAGLSSQTAVEILAGRFAGTHRLTVDAGAHMLPTTMLWPCRAPHDLLISNGLATMGYSVPAAIGSATTDRKTPVVAFIGDGGLLMCAGELLTIVREKLRIVVVVFNDTSLSLIEIKQIARKLKPAGVALGRVDWAAVGAGMGLKTFTARDADELTQAAERAAAANGPALIDVHIDRANYPAIFKAIRGG
jgi:acetolactate synthase-1/2/3 large subunit